LAADHQAGISRKAACKKRAYECFQWQDLAEEMISRYRQIHADSAFG
jgi:hypothetical protein